MGASPDHLGSNCLDFPDHSRSIETTSCTPTSGSGAPCRRSTSISSSRSCRRSHEPSVTTDTSTPRCVLPTKKSATTGGGKDRLLKGRAGHQSTALVLEGSVDPAVDLCDAAMSTPARTRFVGHRHRVYEVIPDQRLCQVVQIGQQQPIRRLPIWHDVAIGIGRLENDQIVGNVHALANAAREGVGAFRAAPELRSLDPPRGPNCLSHGRGANLSRDADPSRLYGKSSLYRL